MLVVPHKAPSAAAHPLEAGGMKVGLDGEHVAPGMSSSLVRPRIRTVSGGALEPQQPQRALN